MHTAGVIPFEVKPDASGIPYIDVQNAPWPLGNPCPVDAAKNQGRPVYPGVTVKDIRYLVGTGDQTPQSLRDKKSSFLISGCFTYTTFKKVRQSPYCLYLQPSRDREIEGSTFEFCPISFSPPD